MTLSTSLLLIADLVADREWFAEFLQQHHYRVTQTDFAGAVEPLGQHRAFALVLVLVGKTTDERTFVRLTRTAKAWRTPLVVTSLETDFEADRWLRLGADDCLLEPRSGALLETRVKIWQEKRENQRLDTFANYWSHELLTLLLSIRAFSNLIVKQEIGPLNEKQLQWLQTAYQNADYGVTLVNTMRDIAQIESGSLLLNLEAVSLVNLVRDVSTSFSKAIEAAGQSTVLQVLHDLPTARADQLRLQQVLEYLIDNANRYTPAGGKITIFGFTEDRAVHIAVRDTGIGIALEDQEHVFTRYWRSTQNPKFMEHRGMGASLYIAKAIVELHGGRMWFESTPHEGSTFHFTVPLADLH
ncbi:MAG TPA: HAMP domain-containing sensor histidine kinase [Aggregatilineales bacterium]|nr:HAMP domain-containing sensor histidine kinase [Aggregatilineales bacterium]